MTLMQFHTQLCKGHLDCVKQVMGYLKKWDPGVIWIQTEEPDYSELPHELYLWLKTVYGDITELIADNIPKPLGNPVLTRTFKDSSLYHDFLTGRAVTGILHLLNKTPIDWFSKRQATVETATYGSEFVAARIAVEQIIDYRLI